VRGSGKRPWKDGRVTLPVVLFVVTTAYLINALQVTTAYDDVGVGPTFFPVVLSVVMYCALAAVLFQALRFPRGAAATPLRLKDPVKIVLLTAAYIALFRPLGYFIATTLYVWSLFFVFEFGSRNQIWKIVSAILIAVAAWLLFDVAFGVRLPKFLDLI
jgi:putative tricarboxylic transport membrane protein